MPDLFDNPMALDGFEFVEFASPTPEVLEPVFEKLGFTRVARGNFKALFESMERDQLRRGVLQEQKAQ